MDIEIRCDIPLPTADEVVSDVLDRARAVCAAASLLRKHDLIDDPDEDEKDAARQIFAAGEGVPNNVSTGIALHLQALITQYDMDIITQAQQLRRYITNRLIEESANAPKAAERLRALELLGKMGDIGLFIERQEITIKDQTTDDIQDQLKRKLEKYMGQVELAPALPPL